MNLKNNKTICIGFFDHLHIGHMKLLSINKSTDVLTFISVPKKTNHIYPLSKRIDDLKQFGIKNIQVFDIDNNNLLAKNFIHKYLINNGYKTLIVGSDFRIGKDQLPINEIKKYINVYALKRTNISTTKIKKWLLEGKVHLANKYTFLPYQITGKVIKGKQLARTLGFCTANLQPDYNIFIKEGIYLTKVYVKQKVYDALTFVGKSKTFNQNELTIESHLLNFNQNIYNKNIQIDFIKRISDIYKFNSIDELKTHIKKLVEKTIKSLNNKL